MIKIMKIVKIKSFLLDINALLPEIMAKYCGVNPSQETISVCDITKYELIFIQRNNGI